MDGPKPDIYFIGNWIQRNHKYYRSISRLYAQDFLNCV